MSRGTRYGYRSRKALLPCVEVVRHDPVVLSHYAASPVVARKYGLTWNQAIGRALKWMQAHGDPR